MFSVGDLVKAKETEPQVFVGIVLAKNKKTSGDYTTVFWSDGDITYHETEKSMAHHKIKPDQWTLPLVKKYLDIICP